MNTIEAPTKAPSVLTKSQKHVLPARIRGGVKIVPTVRYDDQCGNGHNSFAITADLYEKDGRGIWRDAGGGCCHDVIGKAFPELAHLIKWHLTSSDGPMHYVANTVYHAEQHGANRAWVYYSGGIDPLGMGAEKERLLGYYNADKAKQAEGKDGYRVEWDEKTVKIANFDHARSSAVWPEATDEQLSLPKEELTALLLERLPALMAEFQKDVEALGFVF